MLRAPDGSLTSPKAPVMQAIVPLIFIFFSLPGIVYGYAAGTFKSSSDVIKSMEEVMKMLLGFMVFAFFAAQFLYVFGKSPAKKEDESKKACAAPSKAAKPEEKLEGEAA